jgi:hypothetical protein
MGDENKITHASGHFCGEKGNLMPLACGLPCMIIVKCIITNSIMQWSKYITTGILLRALPYCK